METSARPNFTGKAVRAGFRDVLPLQPAYVPFGMIVGIIGQSHGLSLLEISLMSALCYAGSAQLLALGQWGLPVPILGATLAAFVVNLRLVLMGPVLSPWLERTPGWRRWLSLFLMADQNWAMSVTEMKAGRHDLGYLVGSGLAMWITWVLCTAMGHTLGAAMRPPPGHPLFFAATAVFLAILVPLWRGRSELMPWLVAAGVAAAVAHLLPGTSWHVVCGAVAGSAAGAWRDAARGRHIRAGA